MDLLWTDFLNSVQRDWRGGGPAEDRLGRPEWLSGFLATWGLQAPVPASPADLEAALRLRALLFELATRVTVGRALDPTALGALNAFMTQAPVRRSLAGDPEGGYRLELGSEAVGWPAVLGEIAAAFARTLAEADPARVRLCANPDCRWAFYDDTRNGRKRFCDPATCGNLTRVRRFRERRRPG